jgi:hypothetical protein
MNISPETKDIIKIELKTSLERCKYKLSLLPAQHKVDNTNMYQYWIKRIEALEKALKELRGE